jgi:hypothetical protein
MKDVLYDESAVPAHILPDPLLFEDGTPIPSAGEWPRRRGELLRLFADHFYGHAPATICEVEAEATSPAVKVLGGKARMRQSRLHFHHRGRRHHADLLLFLPPESAGPVPAFLGLNFLGNHTVLADPRIPGNDTREAPRGSRAYRWPVADIVGAGFALATVYAGDFDPDYDDGFRNGVHGLFTEEDFAVPGDRRWGTVAAWAWGLSRVREVLADDPAVDASRILAVGHSRMGKAALWAAAQDEAFAAAVSNGSGCAGAALSRRRFGERLFHLLDRFPHWLAPAAKVYVENEAALPVDQHQLLALIAPRPLFVASAEEDLWADPEGEERALLHAGPVYRLLDAADRPAYHRRPGVHDIFPEDWRRFLAFARRWLPPTSP